MAPSLQSGEMTLPSLQGLCLCALVPVCSVAEAGAAAATRMDPIHCDPGKPAAAPHHPDIPVGTLSLPLAIGKAE